ncbi:MAG: hypothetical protein QOK37_3544 [Thermoanaerobaculia bacterium]|nr:hypothetical protein [Thermoanaerobaculia bacterium]
MHVHNLNVGLSIWVYPLGRLRMITESMLNAEQR